MPIRWFCPHITNDRVEKKCEFWYFSLTLANFPDFSSKDNT